MEDKIAAAKSDKDRRELESQRQLLLAQLASQRDVLTRIEQEDAAKEMEIKATPGGAKIVPAQFQETILNRWPSLTVGRRNLLRLKDSYRCL